MHSSRRILFHTLNIYIFDIDNRVSDSVLSYRKCKRRVVGAVSYLANEFSKEQETPIRNSASKASFGEEFSERVFPGRAVPKAPEKYITAIQ
jgi:hypothetical protein